MIRILVALAVLSFTTPTFAQNGGPAPDPASLQKAIAVLQQQRNAAMDQAAGVQVEAQRLAEENAKLKAQIEDMQKKGTTDAK